MNVDLAKQRNPKEIYEISLDNDVSQLNDKLPYYKIHTDSKYFFNKKNNAFEIDFKRNEKEIDIYTISFEIENEVLCTGASLKLALDNWESISYIAFGMIDKTEYKHVKMKNYREKEPFIIEFSIFDLAWKIQNEYIQCDEFLSNKIKIFIKGKPKELENLIIYSLCLFNEKNYPSFRLKTINGYSEVKEFSKVWSKTELKKTNVQHVNKILHDYLLKSNMSYKDDAEFYLSGRGVSLAKNVEITFFREISECIQDNITMRYFFHSQQQVLTLLLFYEDTKDISALFAARDLINHWVDIHYKQKTNDLKYCWYDHGTAERLIVLVRLFVLSNEVGSDFRFLANLLTLIYNHAKLLSSEVFYARDQNYRYHNHGLFQDIALLSTSLILDFFESSCDWKEIALSRMIDQFNHLIYTEGKYSVLKENSPGYHASTSRMVELIVGMLEASGDDEHFEKFQLLYEQMNNFTEIITYPGGRIPAIGDTFRNSNSMHLAKLSRKYSQEVGFFGLDKAGYAVANGTDDDVDFKFILIAPNLNKTHKHEDHLSFVLFYDGIEWLTDPSFYSHQYEDSIPSYLRKASAHNAVFLKDEEYSNELYIATIQTKTAGSHFTINGSHTAYINKKVVRVVDGFTDKLNFKFIDKVETDSDDSIATLAFHCGESIVPELLAEGVVLKSSLSDECLLLSLPEGVQVTVNYGKTSPDYSGWLGAGFTEVQETYSLCCSIDCNTEIEWKLSSYVCKK